MRIAAPPRLTLILTPTAACVALLLSACAGTSGSRLPTASWIQAEPGLSPSPYPSTATSTVPATVTPAPSPVPSTTPTTQPTLTPTFTFTDTPLPSGCPQGCIEQLPGCEIKGNISQTTGEKIFHVPGNEFYEKTIINPDFGERWFCTEEEAIANGWRKTKR